MRLLYKVIQHHVNHIDEVATTITNVAITLEKFGYTAISHDVYSPPNNPKQIMITVLGKLNKD